MSFEQARNYLARVLPWPQNGEAYANIHWTFIPKDKPIKEGERLPWTGRAVRSLDEAVSTLAWASRLPDTRDIYVALSTQREAQEATSKAGRKYLKPVRLAENAVALKSLFLDIDAKESETGYPTLELAIDAVIQFLADAKLPKPSIIVRSGGGLHVYWTFDTALKPTDWYPLACALIEATKRYGLKCDAMVTTDAARVLRVPETFNFKTNPPRPVSLAGTGKDYAVAEIETALAPYKVEATFLGGSDLYTCVEDPALFPRRQALNGPNELGGGIDLHMPRGQVRQCLDAIPNDKTDWNFWNTIGMQVFAATDGADYGLEEWEAWSKKNTTVTQATDNCKDRWATLHGSPPSRTGAGALVNRAREALADPKWFPRGVPVLLPGTGLGITQPPTSDLPQGYFRTPKGLVYTIITDKKTNEQFQIMVSDCYPLTNGRVTKDPDGKSYTLHFTTTTEVNVTKEISVTGEQLISPSDLKAELADQGFLVHGDKTKLTGDFFVSWAQKLQQTKGVQTAIAFGWFDKDGTRGFVYDGTLFLPGGTTPVTGVGGALQTNFTPTGNKQPWDTCSKFLTDQRRPEMDAILASSFAAPLMYFTGHHGVVMSVRSDSGKGKSTAIEIAQAVWGHSKKGKSKLKDTPKSFMNKAGKLQALPLYWDEFRGDKETRMFADIAFQMTLGEEGARLTPGIEQRPTGDWHTILVSASNESVLEHITRHASTTAAGLYRCFEYIIEDEPVGDLDDSDVSRMVGELERHYGHAGRVYAKFLGEQNVRIDAEVGAMHKQIIRETNGHKEERFWTALIALLLLGAKYANELKLTDIDEEALKSFLLKKLALMRGQKSTQQVDLSDADTVSDKLSRFVKSQRATNTIMTARMPKGVGKPPPQPTIGDYSRFKQADIHIAKDDKLMRVSQSALTNWLRDNDINETNFIDSIKKTLGAKGGRGILGAGTIWAGARERYWQFSLTGALSDFIEGI